MKKLLALAFVMALGSVAFGEDTTTPPATGDTKPAATDTTATTPTKTGKMKMAAKKHHKKTTTAPAGDSTPN